MPDALLGPEEEAQIPAGLREETRTTWDSEDRPCLHRGLEHTGWEEGGWLQFLPHSFLSCVSLDWSLNHSELQDPSCVK